DYRDARRATEFQDVAAAGARSRAGYSYLAPEEDRALRDAEDGAVKARRDREAAFVEVLEQLRVAERFWPERPDTEAVRAELFLEKWADARAARDPGAAAYYADLVARHDRGGAFAAKLHDVRRVRIDSAPSGARVSLLRVCE